MQVKLSVLKNYLQAATALYPCIAFLSLAGYVAAQVSTNIWLSKWTLQPVYNGTTDQHTTDVYLGVYGALGAVQCKKHCCCLVVQLSVATVSSSYTCHADCPVLGHTLCSEKTPTYVFD